ncbi:MAG: aminopeptidase P family protein [Ruminococcaceae bacterium]|nr:aminopeptidase P family protein [Oscillospiraceae bacterium]
MSHMQAIQAAMTAAGLEALLLTDPVSCRYAAGFYFTDGAVLIRREDAFLITDSRYTEAAEKEARDVAVLEYGRRRSPYTLAAELCAGLGTVGAEEERMSVSEWRGWEEKMGRKFAEASHVLKGLRKSKDSFERESLIAAQRIAERALDDVLGLLRPGLTEKEVAAELTYRMLLYGGEEMSFDPIVVTGAKTSLPHGVPGDRVICTGDFVTMDFGTKKNGYCSDMTRTVAIGSVTEEMRRVYEIVLEAQLAGIAAARAGVRGCDIDGAARKVIAAAGYGDFFGHGFGHSLGLEIHEAPNANTRNERPMPVGAVISAEPGIYLPGRFGVRIEDVLILNENGSENITKAPKELLIL